MFTYTTQTQEDTNARMFMGRYFDFRMFMDELFGEPHIGLMRTGGIPYEFELKGVASRYFETYEPPPSV